MLKLGAFGSGSLICLLGLQSLKSCLGLEDPLPSSLTHLQEALVPCHAGHKAAHDMASPREGVPRERKPKMGAIVFYSLIWEVTQHYFSCVPLVTWTNPGIHCGRTIQGWEYQGAGIVGDHLGGWLPHMVLK